MTLIKFSLSRLFSAVFITVFGMTLMYQINEGSTVLSIINGIMLLLNIIAVTFDGGKSE